MALVMVMMDCARRSATRACSLFRRVASLRSADSSASVSGCLRVRVRVRVGVRVRVRLRVRVRV